MEISPAAAQQPNSAPETGQSAASPKQNAKAPAADLMATLTETHETILMVEQALIPATGTKDKQRAKAEKRFEQENVCGEDEELIQQCVEVIHNEKMASVSLLQRRLRLGYARAARIMDELERRKIVGPSKGAEPRDILIDTEDGRADGKRPEDDPYDPLLGACLRGDLAEVQSLLATGLDVNHQSGAATALHCAACNGHLAVVQFLLDKGANVDSRLGSIKSRLGPYLEGATPLILSIANHKDQVARLLLSRGANPRAKTHKGLAGEILGQAVGDITFDFAS